MALKTLVKINRVNNLSDARYCSGMGVGMLGFNITIGDTDRISYEQYNGIKEWISGPEFVGEIYGKRIPPLDGYEDLTYLQIQDPELIEEALTYGYRLIYRVNIEEDARKEDIYPLLEDLQFDITYFLIESNFNRIDGIHYQMIKDLAEQFPVILGFGIEKDKIGQLLDDLPVRGISLTGGDEVRPGYKNYDELANVLEEIEEEY